MHFEIAEGFEISCKDCLKIFWICRPCYRGHKYCSTPCRQSGRKKGQKTSKREYEKSQEAKEDHCDRQRAYRSRLKEKCENIAACVTEHSITDAEVSVKTSSEPDCAFCICCKAHRSYPEGIWYDQRE